jgi:hypothetical protein
MPVFGLSISAMISLARLPRAARSRGHSYRLGFHIAALRLSVQACSFLPRHEQAKSALIW